MVIAIDTHHYVKKLMLAGVPESQAETQIEVNLSLLNHFIGELATKQELKDVNASLKQAIKDVDTSLRHEMTILRSEIRSYGRIIIVISGLMLISNFVHTWLPYIHI